jgi:hypothetical protein
MGQKKFFSNFPMMDFKNAQFLDDFKNANCSDVKSYSKKSAFFGQSPNLA